ncbi:MAG TPA: hypothetical protein VIV40_07210 [Kofleriaceae bacterium]
MGLVIVLAITATVIGLVGQLPDPRKVKRELARARIQSINSLVDGKPAAVRGTIATVEDAIVHAPLSNRRCVYSLVVFDEVGVGGDYVELGRLERGLPFLLRSDHGTARVVPDGARLAIYGDVTTQPIIADTPMSRLARSVCKRHNYATSWLRATEYVLEPDAFVTISGWCTREPDPEAAEDVTGYREQLPTRPVISGSRGAKLMIG